MASLDEAQSDLLILLCEAARRQPRDSKESFLGVDMMGGPGINHPMLAGGELTDFHWPDLETLYDCGLIRGRVGQHELIFDVSPNGFEHFDKLMHARGQPTVRLEDTMHRLLDSTWFGSTFPAAMNSWRKAEALYWADTNAEHATAIGHHCREAMQLFGVSFANALEESPGPAEKTIENVRSGLNALRGQLSESRLELLDTLLVYWRTVIAIVQRQEHGASKEGESLGQEDSRIAVFYTALVMFELASALASLAVSDE